VFLAGVSLVRKTSNGLVVRPAHELGALTLAAYGEAIDAGRTSRGLHAAAGALNRGDLALAMVATLHLQLPELDDEEASRIAVVNDFLAKYDRDEPRDWRGRWTTGGAGGPAASPAGATRGPPNIVSDVDQVSPDTIDPAAYNGRYHDEVVAEEAARLRSRGETVLTEVKLQMADGSAGARIDILAFDPQTHNVYGIEVKTGDKPGFTPGQIVVYPHLMMGEAVIATDPRVVALGLIPNFPLMPIPIYLTRQRDKYSTSLTIKIDPFKMSRYYMGKNARAMNPQWEGLREYGNIGR